MFIAHVLPLAESVPKDEDVVAGWLGFFVLLGLIIATALLLWNFTKQIKKAKAANDAGVYGADDGSTDDSSVDGASFDGGSSDGGGSSGD